MIDAVTVTLSILIVVLLRRSLLTNPDAGQGVREVGENFFSTKAPVPVPVQAKSPHPARTKRNLP